MNWEPRRWSSGWKLSTKCGGGVSLAASSSRRVILTDGWEVPYGELIEYLADTLEPETKRGLTVEIILMTYSYVHRAINSEAFPPSPRSVR